MAIFLNPTTKAQKVSIVLRSPLEQDWTEVIGYVLHPDDPNATQPSSMGVNDIAATDMAMGGNIQNSLNGVTQPSENSSSLKFYASVYNEANRRLYAFIEKLSTVTTGTFISSEITINSSVEVPDFD